MINYFLTKLKIVFTDRFTLSIMIVSLILLSIFLFSANEIVRSDKVVIGISEEEDSKISRQVVNVLEGENGTTTVLIKDALAIDAILTGEIDLYLKFDQSADTMISEGNHENLVTLVSDGISIYSVFYPDLILGGIIKEIQLGVVNDYLEELEDKGAELSLEASLVMAREIHDKTYEGRAGSYYIEQQVVASDGSLAQLREADKGILFMKQILGIMMMLLHLLIMMIMVSKVEEYEYHITDRLSVSPVNHMKLMIGQWLTGFIPMSIVAIALTLVIQLTGASSGWLNINILVELLKDIALLVTVMLVLTRVIRHTNIYVFTSLMFILLSAALAGVFFDLSILKGPVTNLVEISPYSNAVNNIMQALLSSM